MKTLLFYLTMNLQLIIMKVENMLTMQSFYGVECKLIMKLYLIILLNFKENVSYKK